jgi:hypothetical protein
MLNSQALVTIEYSIMAKYTMLVILPVWRVTPFYGTFCRVEPVMLFVIVNNRIYRSLLYSICIAD